MLEPEWQPWGPDSPGYPNCPVEPGTDCEVRFLGGYDRRDSLPERWKWKRAGPEYIIAYRVWPAKDDARALLVEVSKAILLHPHSRGCAVHDPGDYRGICTCGAKAKNEYLKALTARIDAYLERNP